MNSTSKKAFFLAVSLLFLLAFAAEYLISCRYAAAHNTIYTGFNWPDMPFYMANARQYWDESRFFPAYANSSSVSDQSPQIYFHLHIFLYALVLKLFHLDPGILDIAVKMVCIALACGLAKLLLHEYAGNATAGQQLLFPLFLWGGGIFLICGLLAHDPLHFETDGGVWCMNFGRGFIYSAQAFFRVLVLCLLLALLQNRQKLFLLALGCLALSHPFTGAQYLMALSAWIVLEKTVFRNRRYSWPVSAAILLMLFLFAGYYMMYLPLFAEHRSVQEQMSLTWTVPLPAMACAYLPLVLLFIYRVRTSERLRNFFAVDFNRFLCTAAVVFMVLAKHELFLRKAMQPVHFTNGNIWMILFLMAAPGLSELLDRLLARKNAAGPVLAALVFMAFFADNTYWFYQRCTNERNFPGVFVTASQKEVLDFLTEHGTTRDVLFSQEARIGYLATVYTPCRSLVAHSYNTPFKEKRLSQLIEFLKTGRIDPEFDGKRVWAVAFLRETNHNVLSTLQRYPAAFRNGEFIIFVREGGAQSPQTGP